MRLPRLVDQPGECFLRKGFLRDRSHVSGRLACNSEQIDVGGVGYPGCKPRVGTCPGEDGHAGLAQGGVVGRRDPFEFFLLSPVEFDVGPQLVANLPDRL